jgi:DHA2 family multidrug resistance protein-like MFS transporter
VGVVFVRRQSKLAYPLLELKLFRQKRFSAAIAAYGLSCLAMFGVYIFITQYLQLVLGLSPLLAGAATVPWSLAFVAGSLLAPRLARRVAPVTIIVGGLLASSVGFLLLLLAHTDIALPSLVLGTVIMSLGMAPVITVANELIITAAPPERAGAASALSETAAEFNAALGIAVLGSIGTAVYRTRLADGVPGDVPAEAMATLGGAESAARALGGPAGDALLAAARASFVDAMQLNAVIGAAVLVVAAFVSARILRGPPGAPHNAAVPGTAAPD